ncbi:uncharacterized protein CTRU02_205152 [Colletotrichum truncatum]|uniref:Uncharacterized protein n=1 Tax=Colletotrichum truncatum TaxID=5467 RepID=A0ACC3Z364_COLTU|nr:uncharacterized protein CTRU02_06026 [Colletotrichum truncatum]KAF6793154.1 hypothetical protein CTRU02_06026 [Colletotrichum truncatum]
MIKRLGRHRAGDVSHAWLVDRKQTYHVRLGHVTLVRKRQFV